MGISGVEGLPKTGFGPVPQHLKQARSTLCGKDSTIEGPAHDGAGNAMGHLKMKEGIPNGWESGSRADCVAGGEDGQGEGGMNATSCWLVAGVWVASTRCAANGQKQGLCQCGCLAFCIFDTGNAAVFVACLTQRNNLNVVAKFPCCMCDFFGFSMSHRCVLYCQPNVCLMLPLRYGKRLVLALCWHFVAPGVLHVGESQPPMPDARQNPSVPVACMIDPAYYPPLASPAYSCFKSL